ncbi:MAG TPA: hypothetical protein VGA19_11420 [Rhodospirillales bacterium]
MFRRSFPVAAWALALAAAAAIGPAAAAAGDRPKVPRSFGHNEIVVARHAALRDQIRACWPVTAMGRRQDLDIHIVVKLRRDGTVEQARVLGPASTPVDPYRRSLMQSARSALAAAACNPLRLPEGAAERDGRITLTLNPAEIFAD